MKSLHIRNVDDPVLERLRRRAQMHHRSLQGELRAILEEAAELVPDRRMTEELDLVKVSMPEAGSWCREMIYDDDAR